MPDPIEESVQSVAAETASNVVAETTAIETAVVDAHVEAVSEQLAEHQEISDERHDEILEAQTWQGQRLTELTTQGTANQSALLALQQGQLQTNQLLLTLQEQLNRISNPTPVIPSENQQNLPVEEPGPSEPAENAAQIAPRSRKLFRSI